MESKTIERRQVLVVAFRANRSSIFDKAHGSQLNIERRIGRGTHQSFNSALESIIASHARSGCLV